MTKVRPVRKRETKEKKNGLWTQINAGSVNAVYMDLNFFLFNFIYFFSVAHIPPDRLNDNKGLKQHWDLEDNLKKPHTMTKWKDAH